MSETPVSPQWAKCRVSRAVAKGALSAPVEVTPCPEVCGKRGLASRICGEFAAKFGGEARLRW